MRRRSWRTGRPATRRGERAAGPGRATGPAAGSGPAAERRDEGGPATPPASDARGCQARPRGRLMGTAPRRRASVPRRSHRRLSTRRAASARPGRVRRASAPTQRRPHRAAAEGPGATAAPSRPSRTGSAGWSCAPASTASRATSRSTAAACSITAAPAHRHRPHRAGDDEGPRRRPVRQARRRDDEADQARPARPRDARGHRRDRAAHRARLRRLPGPRPHPGGDPGGVRDAPGRGHRGRVPGGEPGADADAAQVAAREPGRPGRGGGDHPPGPHPGQRRPPVPASQAGPGARDVPPSRAWSRSSTTPSA